MPELDIASLRQAVQQNRYVITKHAQYRMGLRKITHGDLKYVVAYGDVVEEYPNNRPHPKALFMAHVRANRCTSLARSTGTVLISLLFIDTMPPSGSIPGPEGKE